MKIAKARSEILWCLAIFTLALILRVSALSANSLWPDEHCSVRDGLGQAAGEQKVAAMLTGPFTPEVFWRQNTLPNVIRATFAIENGNSVAYNVVLHFWYGIFDFSTNSSRALSVLFGLATVMLGFWFVRIHFNSTRLAALTGIGLAVHPFLIAYSREVRSYAMAVFFALLASHVFLLILRSKRKSPPLMLGFIYFLSVTLSVFSHYLALYLYLAHGICALVYARSFRRFSFLAVPMVAFGALFALWWFAGGGMEGYGRMAEHGVLWKERSLTTMPELKFGVHTTPHWFKETLASVFNIRSALTNTMLWGSKIPFRVLSLLTVLAYSLGIASVLRRGIFEKRLVWCVASMAFVCPVVGLAMAFHSGMNLSLLHRFSICSLPFGMLLVALSVFDLSRMPKWQSVFLTTMVVLQFVVFTPIALRPDYGYEALSHPSPSRLNRYVEVAKRINAAYKPGNLVVYSSTYDANMVSLYLGRESRVQQSLNLKMESDIVLLQGKEGTTRLADSSLPPN